jgi:hypothetical protein
MNTANQTSLLQVSTGHLNEQTLPVLITNLLLLSKTGFKRFRESHLTEYLIKASPTFKKNGNSIVLPQIILPKRSKPLYPQDSASGLEEYAVFFALHGNVYSADNLKIFRTIFLTLIPRYAYWFNHPQGVLTDEERRALLNELAILEQYTIKGQDAIIDPTDEPMF